MFRTRDFVLIFVTVVFLVSAIGATLWHKNIATDVRSTDIKLVEETSADHMAVVDSPESFSRQERLENMRKKIADGQGMVFTAPAADETPAIVEEELSVEDEIESVIGAEMKCPGYVEYTAPWSATGVNIESVEWARVVFREVVTEPVTDQTATATSEVLPSKTDREVLLQLPTQPVNLSQPACIPSDVVGIAQDGSLIRNSESELYGVFGADTLIGYAIDGFPIYGTSDIQTDACGGIITTEGYRYFISSERDEILGCFRAAPINL